MVAIPENTLSMEDLLAWDEAKRELSAWKAKEMLLRMKIFRAAFPAPHEGTNNFTLPSGYILKGKYSLNRDVDPGELFARGEEFAQAGISVDALIKRTPELIKGAYNQLTAEQKALFDNALIIKPGTPSIEIADPPKRRVAGQEQT